MELPVDPAQSDALAAARAPIASLISKSEKAQQKLAPGAWQHTMLQNNLRALRLASALMNPPPGPASGTLPRFDAAALEQALAALASMIARTEKPRFAPGTPQHTLQRNRLKALRLAETIVRAEAGRVE